MFPRSSLRIFALAALAALCLWQTGCRGTTGTKVSPGSASVLPATRPVPGPNDAGIAHVTARLLETFHYSQLPLDTEMSGKFFDGYLESLDSQHLHFLQSDIAGFAPYRTNLDKLTINDRGTADVTPAYEIFNRFRERLEQHIAYVDELLKRDKFKFNTEECILLDRRHAPFPKDLDEARELWRQRLRYEYLQEKLSREISPTNHNVALTPPKSDTAEIIELLARRYHRNLHLFAEWDSTDVLQIYLNALSHAYDPHSDYLNAVHAQDFSIGMSLSLFGIGAQLTEVDGYCTINSLIRGGPAQKSQQLREKDRIIAVAQSNQPPVDVVDMELGKVVQMIRGPKGTEVRLTVIPADNASARHGVSLIRDEIKLEDQEAKARIIEMPDGKGGSLRLGIIDLPSFYATIDLPGSPGHSAKSATADVSRLIKKLEEEKVAGIILDLRNNPGGSLEEAVKLTGLFIKEGPVVLARNPNGRVAIDSDTNPEMLYSGPLVVLVNRLSASAAEIVAAALQDYDRALVVGDISTHGKGTVQDLHSLRPFVWPTTKSATNDPGELKITIRKFYRVNGASTQKNGVTPDIVLPSVLSYRDNVGESSLNNPLPWDTVPSADYEPLNFVKPYLAELSLLSNARVATNQDFAYIRQDIDELRKLQADKTASLNEREQLKEREEIEARQKARDRERDARKMPDEKIYELTVENADQPGLPPPIGETNTAAANSLPAVSYGLDSNFTNYFGTNTATGATNLLKSAATEKKPAPAVDPMLDETEHILEDYISLLSSNRVLIAN
jgi:carboxyl-terminal processing protease